MYQLSRTVFQVNRSTRRRFLAVMVNNGHFVACGGVASSVMMVVVMMMVLSWKLSRVHVFNGLAQLDTTKRKRLKYRH